jgi:hypothetical protein
VVQAWSFSHHHDFTNYYSIFWQVGHGNSMVSSEIEGVQGGAVHWFDVYGDGDLELVAQGAVTNQGGDLVEEVSCTSSGYPTAAVGDLDGDGNVEVGCAAGIWEVETGELREWEGIEPYTFQGGGVQIQGELGVLATVGDAVILGRLDGSLRWKSDYALNSLGGFAFGDVDGDGEPEAVAQWLSMISLVNADGTVRWEYTAESSLNAISMADLDANGGYEILAYGNAGLWILDGATGTVLASQTEVTTNETMNAVLVADIDGDNSAEIVVAGVNATAQKRVVRAYGPATGRWARTRPVWNEPAYDITSIADDGTLLTWPLPSWESYNAWRAQPAHDGDLPDLTVAATGLCCDETTAFLAVQAENQGSQPALSGATVRLFTHQGSQWVEVASQVLPEVPEQEALEGFIFEVPLDQWGDQQVLQIDGVDTRACNRVNDRVPVTLSCE